jgi:hypothetical protein
MLAGGHNVAASRVDRSASQPHAVLQWFRDLRGRGCSGWLALVTWRTVGNLSYTAIRLMFTECGLIYIVT